MIKINQFSEFKYGLPNKLMSKYQLLKALVLFRREVVRELPNTHSIGLQLKVLMSDDYRSISGYSTIRIEDLTKLVNMWILNVDLRSDIYNQYGVDAYIIGYYILPLVKESKINKPKVLRSKEIKIIKFGGYNFPQTMDLSEWGEVQFMFNEREAIVYKYRSVGELHVRFNKNISNIKLKVRGETILKFTDELLNPGNMGTFKRTFNNQVYYFEDGKLIYKSITYNKPYIPTISKTIEYNQKIITMDLETRNINGIISPYCISLYDGIKFKFFYLSDYKNTSELIKDSIKYLMQRRYNGSRVYLHNLSKFDGTFLVRYLPELSDKIQINIREGNIINIRFYYGKYVIYFIDSFLILPASLRQLSKTFNVEDKGIFPYKFVDNVDLDYKGSLPDFKYFYGISECQYKDYMKDYVGKSWELRRESERYCNQDCLVLYNVLIKFSKLIFDKFFINVNRYPTLSSLAFAIYRSNFLKKDHICLLDGKIFDYIQSSYKGGYVEVFKPRGNNIKAYDVNSLYPYIMRNYKLPVGQPTYFEGSEMDPNFLDNPTKFFFIRVEVESPTVMYRPFLLHKIKLPGGNYRTIAPLGSWTDIYTGIEIKKAIQLGYKIKFLDGLIFNADYIFRDYVDVLYNIKSNNSKESALYLICKLLLNGLYGRFALNPDMPENKIVESNTISHYLENYKVEDILELSNNKVLIRYEEENKKDFNSKFKLSYSSIAISAGVTALARTYMYDFIVKYDAYYTDTDSIYTDKVLDQKIVGRNLGQFKLEYTFDEAVFLSPKVYGGINTDLELIRVKGLKNPVTFEQLKTLLNKDCSLQVSQEKWYRSMKRAEIYICNEVYSLMINENKRKLIYKDSQFTNTIPLILNNGKYLKYCGDAILNY